MTFEPRAFLLVEDSDTDVLLMERAFTKAAVSNPLIVVKDGINALSYLKGEGAYCDIEKYPLPAVILLDLKMPRMDGFEVLEWVRKHPVLKPLFIVVQTSTTRPEDIRRAYELGANGFLVKPSSLDALIRMVQTLCDWVALNQLPTLVGEQSLRSGRGRT